MTYANYLKTGHWQVLRSKALACAQHSCEACGTKRSFSCSLHVHHINYRNLFDCTTEDVIALCESCHNLLHAVLSSLGVKPSAYSRLKTLNLIRYGFPERPACFDKQPVKEEVFPPARGKNYGKNCAMDFYRDRIIKQAGAKAKGER